MIINYQKYKTPIGILYLVSDKKHLRAVMYKSIWDKYRKNLIKSKYTILNKNTEVITQAKIQLNEYFKSQRRTFNLPLFITGTDFQVKAWKSLLKVPFGKTSTYKEQSALINAPKAFRAVGSANGKNPFCIVLPCHRIIGSNGQLTGYAGGIKAKKILLELERAATR